MLQGDQIFTDFSNEFLCDIVLSRADLICDPVDEVLTAGLSNDIGNPGLKRAKILGEIR